MQARVVIVTSFLMVGFLVACGAPAAPAPQPAATGAAAAAQPAATEAPAPAAPTSANVVLKVAVPGYMAQEARLADALASATKQLEFDTKRTPGSIKTQIIPIDGCLGCQCSVVNPEALVGNPPDGNPVSLGDVDLFLAPSNIVAIFQAWYGDKIKLSKMPADLQLDAISEQVLNGFRDPENNLLAVPQATMPAMLIYNPMLLQKYSDAPAGLNNVSWADMAAMTGKLEDVADLERSAVLLADSSVAMAEVDSQTRGSLKQELNILEFLKGGFVKLADQSDADRDKFFQSKKVASSMAYPGVHEAFAAGKLPFVLGTSGFLTGLREEGFKDDARVGYLPSYGDPKTDRGTTAVMLGWMVPDRPESQLAWQLASTLSQDPIMAEVGLRSGFLPAGSKAWTNLDQSKWSSTLSVDSMGVEMLKELAGQSTAWQIPKEFNSIAYAPVLNAIIDLEAKSAALLADDKISVNDLGKMLAALFSQEANKLP